jgi:hypothetical protein
VFYPRKPKPCDIQGLGALPVCAAQHFGSPAIIEKPTLYRQDHKSVALKNAHSSAPQIETPAQIRVISNIFLAMKEVIQSCANGMAPDCAIGALIVWAADWP